MNWLITSAKEELPAIVKELAKHATQMRLTPNDAERVIHIGIARHRFGNHPDETLVRLALLVELNSDEPWYEKAIAALQDREPDTDESACSIINEIRQEHFEAEDKAERKAEEAALLRNPEGDDDEAKDEAESILDGAPPVLPPPTTPPEPQMLQAHTPWEGIGSFTRAVTDLHELHTKPAARFAGMVSPTVLREVGDFLMAVAAADKQHADTANAGELA